MYVGSHLRANFVGYHIFITLSLWTLPVLMRWHLPPNAIGKYLRLDWFFPYLLMSWFFFSPSGYLWYPSFVFGVQEPWFSYSSISPLKYSIVFSSSDKLFSISKKFSCILSLGVFFVIFAGFSTSGMLFCVYSPTFKNDLKKITVVISNCFSNAEIKI